MNGTGADHGRTMPWTGHLEELRTRIIWVLALFLLMCIAGWWGAPWVLGWLQHFVERLIFVTPAEAFMAHVQIALALGLLLVSPIALLEAWWFVRPGLLPHEIRVARVVAPICYLLFLLGLAVGALGVIPVTVGMLLDSAHGPVQPAISVGRYLSMVWATLITCGLTLQVPVLSAGLAILGLTDGWWPRSRRRLILLMAVIVGGFISTKGLAMQVLLVLPVYVLFELGLLVGGWLRGREAHT